MTRSLNALGTSCSFINSRTLLSMSWYLAVAEVICWMIVVTCPKIVAYSSAATLAYRLERLSCALRGACRLAARATLHTARSNVHHRQTHLKSYDTITMPQRNTQ